MHILHDYILLINWTQFHMSGIRQFLFHSDVRTLHALPGSNLIHTDSQAAPTGLAQVFYSISLQGMTLL